MLTNIMYFNSLSHISLNKLLLNFGSRNADSAWSEMYDLIPRSLKSHTFGENYQESDFYAGNGRHLEKWRHHFLEYGLTTPNASPIETHVNCLNSAGRFHHFSPY